MTLVIFARRRPVIDWSFLGGVLPEACSFARASAGWRFNASGVLESVAAGSPRFDYDPITLAAKGLLYGASRTNVLKYTDMSGAAAGALPTGWSTYLATVTGLTYAVSAVGTEYGMNYIDYAVSGTPSATDSLLLIPVSKSQSIAAVQNDLVTGSAFVRLVGGAVNNNVDFQIIFVEYSSGGTWLVNGSSSFVPTNVLSRPSYTRTISNASCSIAQFQIGFHVTSGQAVNFTLRIYAPQSEKGATVSSPIITNSAAVTRAADVLSFAIPNGVTRLRYMFDDNSVQDVSVSAGAYTVPTNLSRARIKRITGYKS